MRNNVLLMFGLFLLVFTNLSYAQPVTELKINFEEGYVISMSAQEVIEQNEDYKINFFTYNRTTGYPVDNTTLNCTLYISDDAGTLIHYDDVDYNLVGYWSETIGGGNFSEIGIYTYGIKCDDGTMGGVRTGYWEVTSQGVKVTEGQSIIYVFGAFFVFLIFVLTLYSSITIPWEDGRDNEGNILYINYKKYLKFAMGFASYLSLMFFFFIGKGMSYAFLSSTELYGFFNVTSTIMVSILMPIMILASTFVILSMLTDKKLDRLLKRGIQVK